MHCTFNKLEPHSSKVNTLQSSWEGLCKHKSPGSFGEVWNETQNARF